MVWIVAAALVVYLAEQTLHTTTLCNSSNAAQFHLLVHILVIAAISTMAVRSTH
jgi:hypothetical protein